MKVVLEFANRMGSDAIQVDNKITCSSIQHSLEGQVFHAAFKASEHSDWSGDYSLVVLGTHQVENASTALTALTRLRELGYRISKGQIAEGLKNVFWPCRFEVVSRNPLMVLDSAHNVDSAEKLKQCISDYLGGRKIILIFGASVDKDIAGMFKVLLPGIEKVILSKSEHPRAAEPAMLVKLVRDNPVPCEVAENITEAIQIAIKQADSQTAVVVAGSIFMAAAAREVIIKS
ncbi:hypothetical protein EG834_03995 [bacterium]|nr:hypothetical protein [bacterium]